MKIYFERFLICSKCRDSERETANKIDFDWIGKLLHSMFMSDFLSKHKDCKSYPILTKWKKGYMSD